MARDDIGDRFAEVAGLYEKYTVYDMHYEKIGEVDDVFLDEDDRPEYIGVKMGFLGLRKTLVPWEIVRVNEKRQLMEISKSKEKVKDAPTFDDDEEITPELEEQIYEYFGLQRADGSERGAYGAYYRNEDSPSSPFSAETGSASRPGDADRGREGGRPTFRKRARTERRPEETGTQRTPEAGRGKSSSGAGSDEGTVVMPRMEEEVVIRKRLVVKEKIRIRKHVVEDEEIIEVPVRKEEVRIEDETRRRDV